MRSHRDVWRQLSVPCVRNAARQLFSPARRSSGCDPTGCFLLLEKPCGFHPAVRQEQKTWCELYSQATYYSSSYYYYFSSGARARSAESSRPGLNLIRRDVLFRRETLGRESPQVDGGTCGAWQRGSLCVSTKGCCVFSRSYTFILTSHSCNLIPQV